MKKHLKTSVLGLLVSLSLSHQALHAASATWFGTSNGNWNNNSNWSASPFPGSGDTATFNANSTNTSISMGAAITLANIVFDSTNVVGYTFNAGGGSLTLGTNPSSITINSNVGAVTQTFDLLVNVNFNTNIVNNSALASINFSQGIRNTGTNARNLRFQGSGNGGTINGINQSTNAANIFFESTAGVWNVTGTSNSTGTLTVSGVGGTVRLSSDLSTTSSTSLTGGTLQINNSNANGGLSALTQNGGTLEAFGADRVINTGTHAITVAGFTGNHSLTIGSLVTGTGSSSTITNNIIAGKLLTFNNANFYLNNTETTGARTFAGSGDTLISSNIANNALANTAAFGITKSGGGRLILSGNNSYTGSTRIQQGLVRLDSANALGSGNLGLEGGVLGLGAGNMTRSLGSGTNQIRWGFGTDTSGGFAAYGANRIVNINNDSSSITWGALNFVGNTSNLLFGWSDSTHTIVFQNGINLGATNRTIEVYDGVSSANIDGELSGALTGTGGLIKTGLGTLALTGTNTYSGVTQVNAGRLVVNGSLTNSNVSVGSGATLSGSGTVQNVTIASGGTLAPGNSPGTIQTGNLELAGTLSMEINGILAGTDYDQVNVTGSVNLISGNSLNLSLGYVPVANTLFFLIVNDGVDSITGLLNGYAQGDEFSAAGYLWKISYTADYGSSSFTGGNDLALLAIPEPQAGILAAVGLCFVLFLRRRGSHFKASK